MRTIFVMIKSDLGRAYEVADAAVQTVEEVSEVHSISGQYDLLVKCYLPDDRDVGHFVTDRIQRLSVNSVGHRIAGHGGHRHRFREGFFDSGPGKKGSQQRRRSLHR